MPFAVTVAVAVALAIFLFIFNFKKKKQIQQNPTAQFICVRTDVKIDMLLCALCSLGGAVQIHMQTSDFNTTQSRNVKTALTPNWPNAKAYGL